jgi:hypothetical protein
MDETFLVMVNYNSSVKGNLCMVVKRILCSNRLRRIPKHFSWLDHRLVRDNRVCGLSHHSLALYLFLVTVSDADGLSYYSDSAINRYLGMDSIMISMARAELCHTGLIAFSRPLYQVLSLENVTPAVLCEHPTRRGKSDPVSIGDILRKSLEGEQ